MLIIKMFWIELLAENGFFEGKISESTHDVVKSSKIIPNSMCIAGSGFIV